MERSVGASDAATLAQVGRATIKAMRQRSLISKFFTDERVELRKSLEELLVEVQRVDPNRWTEDDFVATNDMFKSVIFHLERYQTAHGDGDLALCSFIGSAVKVLREAQRWIVQGYSPDPAKRPTEAERRRRAEEHAATSLRDLFA
jgi:hypothetical protein